MAQQTINIGATANDGTGDSLRTGGDKINDNFTELYARGGVAALTGIYVSPEGDDATETGGPQVPFATLAAAYAYAKTQSPGANDPLTIHISSGVHAVTSLAMDTAHIHVVGSGAGQSVVVLSAGPISMQAADSSLVSLSLLAGGIYAGPLLQTDTVTDQATHLANLVVRDCRVVNANSNGIAFGRWAGICENVTVEAMGTGGVALQLNFGGEWRSSRLKAKASVVEKSVSNASPADDVTRQVATFHGCVLEGIDPACQVFGGLVEEETDFIRVGVSWWPTMLNGCAIFGPVSNGSITGYTMRGCFLASGCSIYGGNTFYQCHDGYVNGSYMVQTTQSPDAYMMTGCRNFQLTGCNFHGGWGHNPVQFDDNFACMWSSSVTELDAVDYAKAHQHYMLGLVYLGYPGGPRMIDWMQKNIAARFTAADLTYMEIESTAAFALATITVEFWMKTDAAAPSSVLGGIGAGSGTGWFIGLDGGANKQIYVVHGAQNIVVNSQTAAFDGDAHHVAFVSDGANTALYLDGTRIGTGTAGAPAGATKIGIGCKKGAGFGFDDWFSGDLWEIRISSTARYSGASITGGPKKHFFPDDDTLALYKSETALPYTWTDATGNYDATMYGKNVSGNYSDLNPYWVPIDRPLP